MTHQESGATLVDEEITYAESPSEGFSLCGFTPRKEVDREGSYSFTQYLDGLKLFPWKLASIVFALVVLVLGWFGRQELMQPARGGSLK